MGKDIGGSEGSRARKVNLSLIGGCVHQQREPIRNRGLCLRSPLSLSDLDKIEKGKGKERHTPEKVISLGKHTPPER